MKKSSGRPRHWSAAETAALTHSPDPQATVEAALSVKKVLFTGSELSQQARSAGVAQISETEPRVCHRRPKTAPLWYFHNNFCKVPHWCQLATVSSRKVLGFFFFNCWDDQNNPLKEVSKNFCHFLNINWSGNALASKISPTSKPLFSAVY